MSFRIFNYDDEEAQALHLTARTKPTAVFSPGDLEVQPLFWSVPPRPDPSAVYAPSIGPDAALVLALGDDAEYVLNVSSDAAYTVDSKD